MIRGLMTGALAVLLGAMGSWAQPLTPDPSVVEGELPNGLRYIIKQHGNPPERAAMWMHVSTGSLNETDEQRGIAHFLEHMAFNGSENFAPGDLVPFFESLGLTFGRHQNAYTTFDQTTYILELPDNEVATLEKGLLFFSDVAGKLLLLDAEIENERGVILEEKRTGQGPQQRIMDQIFKKLAPGSRFGERLPIGVEETLLSMDRDDFVSYYETWYTPSNTTLMVVADMDPAVVQQEIEEAFGGGERVERPVDIDPKITAYTERGAIVATDDELTSADVGIIRIEPTRGPVTTEQGYRDRLVDEIATWAFNRRLSAKVNEGSVAFLGGQAMTADMFQALRFMQVSAAGEPGKWRDMLQDLGRELQRARLHGFSEREIEDARKALIAQGERAVERATTRPATAYLNAFNEAVGQNEPIVSPKENLGLLHKHVPGISVSEVSERFATLFDPKAVMFIAELPTSVDVPTEEQLLAFGSECVDVKPEAEKERARATAFLNELPEAGQVREIEKHEASEVWSAWLSNNVRMHYRYMDYEEEQATILISLAAGELLETSENRGISEAAALALGRPATQSISSTDVRDLMTGRKVSVNGSAGLDTLSIRVSGNPSDLEHGMQLAYLLLTEPKVEQAAFDQWSQATIQQIEGRKQQPQGVIGEVLMGSLVPEGEARVRLLETAQVEKLTREAAQEWLERVIVNSPIEVSVVGDIEQELAFKLVEQYIGSLPTRDRISELTLRSRRDIAAPIKDIEITRELKTQTQLAIVVGGFFGPGPKELRERRLMNVASQILSTRMIKQIREEEQLVYSISTSMSPMEPIPGLGFVAAGSACDPANSETLATRVHQMFAAFAEGGPSEEELETAKKQIDNEVDEAIEEPSFWLNRLSGLTYRGKSIDDILDARESYKAFTTDEVRGAFKRYYTGRPKMTIIVRPESDAGGAG